jgi:hypothetical protein
VECNLGRLEIKVQMVGLECIDLNTSVGGSLLENGYGKCSFVLVALSESRWWWRGIYSINQKLNRYKLYAQLGDTRMKSQ